MQVARLLADFLIPSITTLGVLALNIDYILRLNCDLYAEGNSRAYILGEYIKRNVLALFHIVQEPCESRGGRPGLSVLMSILVSVDVKIY